MSSLIIKTLLVLALSGAVPALAAPLYWQAPTQWNNGTPMPGASIRYYNIRCGEVEDAPTLLYSVDAPATSVDVSSNSALWCTVTAVAETEDGSLREGSYGDFVLHDPSFAPAAVIGVVSGGVPPPPKCESPAPCPLAQ